MEYGEAIVFAKETGSWMIPVKERPILAAYLKSLAATTTPEAYAAAVVPLLKRDALSSLADGVYALARRAANKLQKQHLAAEVERLRIRVEPDAAGPGREP